MSQKTTDTTEIAPSDVFDAAFAEGLKADLPPASSTTPVASEEPAVAPATSETPAETPAASEQPSTTPAASETPSAPPAEAAAGVVEPEKPVEKPVEQPQNEDLLRRLAELVREPAPQPAPAATPAPQEIYTAEEKQILTSYEQDWPDVARAESLKRRGEYRELVGFVFQEIAKHFNPLQETVEQLASHTQLTELKSTVSDYEIVRDKVVEWANTQPPYLQAAYKHVIERGTVDEVADLIDRYKKETGATSAAPTSPPAVPPATPKPDTELPAATKKAAAALAPVSSKRSAVTQADDPNDFDGAFQKFLTAQV